MSGTVLHEVIKEELLALDAVGARLMVAVSGGPDSVALCRLLHDLRTDLSLDLIVAHVNHQLRQPAADEDEGFVRDLASRLGLPFECRRLTPEERGRSDRYRTLEEWAREARYAALAEIARETASPFVATGHTADDQAETVLLRIVRGTGLAGLTGIPVRRQLVPGVEVIRPALRLRREALVEWLRTIGQPYRTDELNLNPAFTRNRIRHEVLPLLRQINPRVEEAICRLSSVAAEYLAVLEPLTAELRQRAVLYDGEQKVILSAPALERAPGILARELFRELWAEKGWPQQAMGFTEWSRLEDLLYSNEGVVELPGHIRARRFGGTIVIEAVQPTSATAVSGKSMPEQ